MLDRPVTSLRCHCHAARLEAHVHMALRSKQLHMEHTPRPIPCSSSRLFRQTCAYSQQGSRQSHACVLLRVLCPSALAPLARTSTHVISSDHQLAFMAAIEFLGNAAHACAACYHASAPSARSSPYHTHLHRFAADCAIRMRAGCWRSSCWRASAPLAQTSPRRRLQRRQAPALCTSCLLRCGVYPLLTMPAAQGLATHALPCPPRVLSWGGKGIPPLRQRPCCFPLDCCPHVCCC